MNFCLKTKMSIRNPYSLPVVLFLLVVLFFSFSIPFDFLYEWDDTAFITENKRLAFCLENILFYWKTGMQNLWTPLTMMSLMFDHLIWGTSSPCGYRAVNILMHSGTAVLFFLILRRLGIRESLAFFCAVFWGLHPQRLESVIWIAERKDVLSGILGAASFLFYMKALSENKKWLWGTAVFYFLAFAAKPSVIGLPIVCAVYSCYFNGYKRKSLLFPVFLCFITGLLSYFLSFHSSPEPESFLRILSVVSHNLLFYISNTVFPFEQNSCYPLVQWDDFWILPAFILIFLISIAAMKKAGMQWRTIVFILLGFGTAFSSFFAMCTGGFIFNPTDYADRYTYLLSMPVLAGIGFICEQIFQKRPSLQRGTCIVLGLLLFFSVMQSIRYYPAWKNDAVRLRYAMEHSIVPNDEAAASYGKKGMISANPEMIKKAAAGLVCKFSIPDYPRNSREMERSRKQISLIFMFSAAYYENQHDAAMSYLHQFLQERHPIRFYNMPLIGIFKDLAFHAVFQYKNPALIQEFLDWAATEQSVKLRPPIPIDYYLSGFQQYKNGNHKKAAEIWRSGLQEYPDSEELKNCLQKVHDLK